MNELQIIVSQKPGVIGTNFEDIKQELSAQMQIYKELEVTEANKPERKKDVATLRKMAKAVNDKKVEVKNEFLKPYTAFEENVKQLIEIINEPIGMIDNQVKEFEEKQRIQKQEDIKNAFNSIIAGYPSLIDEIGLVVVYDNRWENATATMKSVKDEMTAKLNTIRDNVALISSMVSDKTEEALSLFWGDLDVAKAMQMINRYESQKREIQARLEEQNRKDKEAEEERQRLARDRELEREKQKVRDQELARIRKEENDRKEEQRRITEAEERIREEEAKKTAEAEERIGEEERLATEKRLMEVKAPAPVDDLEAPFIVSDEVTAVFTVTGTAEELQQVEMYLNSIGLLFERKDA
jgi:hypothetical protein